MCVRVCSSTLEGVRVCDRKAVFGYVMSVCFCNSACGVKVFTARAVVVGGCLRVYFVCESESWS